MVVIAGLVALFGAIIGSFLNVVAHRVPGGHSVVSPPSACPHCDAAIRARHNIPLIGWLILRGRCHDCSASISVRYPIVEAFTAAAFFATTLLIGLEWSLVAHLWFVSVTLVFILTDLDHHRLPNAIMLPGTIGGTLLLGGGALADDRVGDFVEALAAGVGYFLLMLLIALVARGGFGFGDVKLAFLLGMFAGYWGGWPLAVLAAFAGFMLGGVLSLFLLATRLKGRKDAIAFGPPMILGSWIAIVWGRSILDWYLRL